MKKNTDKSIILSDIFKSKKIKEKTEVDKSINLENFFAKQPNNKMNGSGRPKKYKDKDDEKEKRKEYRKTWYTKNKKEVLKKNEQYREDHKEEIKEKDKKYYEKKKDKNKK